MKCPHCEYRDGLEWCGDEYEEHNGDFGGFFSLAFAVERPKFSFADKERREVYACPKCKMLFIED